MNCKVGHRRTRGTTARRTPTDGEAPQCWPACTGEGGGGGGGGGTGGGGRVGRGKRAGATAGPLQGPPRCWAAGPGSRGAGAHKGELPRSRPPRLPVVERLRPGRLPGVLRLRGRPEASSTCGCKARLLGLSAPHGSGVNFARQPSVRTRSRKATAPPPPRRSALATAGSFAPELLCPFGAPLRRAHAPRAETVDRRSCPRVETVSKRPLTSGCHSVELSANAY
mmetsp:Transcript_101830/g.276841  ORF Transcript_101830/g.276841 Transcript_101830/m.276841 type:complete len:224 (-) Transcript_101830:183-854(-)